MQTIVLILVLAITVEAIIQYSKTILEMFEKKQYKTFATQLAAILISVFICFRLSIYSVASSITELPSRKNWSGLFPRVRYSSLPWLNCIPMASQIFSVRHAFSTCSKILFGSNQKTFATSGNGIGCSIDYLEQVQLRLKSVKIENRDFEPILKTYDRPDALFYLDPPYLGTEKNYEGTFGWKDHLRLAANLKDSKGRFVLSYNDDPRIRELYDWCDIKATARRETLSGAGKIKVHSRK